MTINITLIDKNKILCNVKEWIKYIKSEFQIEEYDYSNVFEIGTINDEKIILTVSTIPPKPLIEYSIKIDNVNKPQFDDLLDFLIENTKYI